MKNYYDDLDMGICIQKYIETEDGKGDFLPVYANQAFAESMGITVDMLFKFSLRQASGGFPDKNLQDMVDVAFKGTVIRGNCFSRDFSKYFAVTISQYQYGYVMNFQADVTDIYMNAKTLNSVEISFEEIYYARLTDPVCRKIYPEQDILIHDIDNMEYEKLVDYLIIDKKVHPDDVTVLRQLFDVGRVKKDLREREYLDIYFRREAEVGTYKWYLLNLIVNERQDGDIIGLTITIKDVDEMVNYQMDKQKELKEALHQAEAANQAKDSFLSHMSHDLRTPINGILGLLDMLEMENDSQVESELGVGSTFTIRVPIKIDYETHRKSQSEDYAKNLVGKKALLVEDNKINMMIAECFLEKANVAIVKAENGKKALDLFKQSSENEFDFVLMDVMMPVMNGLEATSAIRALDREDAKKVPIVAVSANAFPEDVKKGFEAGMTEYIAKPLDRELLYETVSRFLL